MSSRPEAHYKAQGTVVTIGFFFKIAIPSAAHRRASGTELPCAGSHCPTALPSPSTYKKCAFHLLCAGCPGLTLAARSG